MNTKSILVLDTETIGLDKNSRIIEISTLDHNLSPHENPNPQHSLPVSPEHLFCHMWFIMWFIGKHQLPCIIDARQLDSSTARQGGQPGGKEVMEDALWPGCGIGSSIDRQLGRLGSPAAKEVMEDALWPGSRNIRALTWPTLAARTKRQLGNPAARKSWKMRCGPALERSAP